MAFLRNFPLIALRFSLTRSVEFVLFVGNEGLNISTDEERANDETVRTPALLSELQIGLPLYALRVS